MHLPLTSLVPSVVQLIRYWVEEAPHFGNFPFWYLGSVPYQYLIGPVIPWIVSRVHAFYPESNLAFIYIWLVYVVWFLGGGVGVWVLARMLGMGAKLRVLVEVVFLMFPLQLLLFAIGNGLYHIATVLMIWGLICIYKALESQKSWWFLISSLLVCAVLWVHLASVVALFVGALALVFLFRRNTWSEGVFQLIIVFLLGFALSTLWYGWGFYVVLLKNPSFGGRSLFSVSSWLFQLVQMVLPLILAVFVVLKRSEKISLVMRFVLIFGSSFLTLSCIRLVSDVDYWMDWVGYGLELQLCVALMMPKLLLRIAVKRYVTLIISTLLCILLFTINVYLLYFWFVRDDVQVKAYKNDVISLLSFTQEYSKDARVFLSGSPVFWVGEELPLLIQVRGGRDEVVPTQGWAQAAYVFREGRDDVGIAAWVSKLHISYLLVQNRYSSFEYFKDFTSLVGFDQFRLVKELHGNRLYATDIKSEVAHSEKNADQMAANIGFIISLFIVVLLVLCLYAHKSLYRVLKERLPVFYESSEDE